MRKHLQNNKKIKLIYFDFAFWRIDICRLSLSIGKIPYEYERIPRNEWDQKKNSGQFPFGQLPTMIINGKKIAQTSAMVRYCGKLANLYPDDPYECLLIDQIIDVVNDITYLIGPSIREKNIKKKRRMRLKLDNKTLPIWLSHIENFLSEHNESNFLLTKKFTIADIIMWRFLLWLKCGLLENISTDLMKKFKKIDNYFNNISSNKIITDTIEYKEIVSEISNKVNKM